jgi:hypothetical protein
MIVIFGFGSICAALALLVYSQRRKPITTSAR